MRVLCLLCSIPPALFFVSCYHLRVFCREVLRLSGELDSQQMRACVLLETLETLQVCGTAC